MQDTVTDLHKSALKDTTVLLYNNGILGILISILTSTSMVFAIGQTNQLKVFWWVIISVLMLLRASDLLKWKKLERSNQFEGARWIRRYCLGVCLSAVLWSLYSVYTVFTGSLVEVTAIIIVIAAMAGGSATVLAAHKTVAIFYALTLLLPSSICLVVIGKEAQLVLGLLGFCFAVSMAVLSKKAADFTTEAIRLKNENAVLVNHMELQVEERTKQIYELSNIDPLTGLFNRVAFLKHLKHLMTMFNNQSEGFITLLFVDLDGFKKVNDSFGHEAGDSVLRQSANRLNKIVNDKYKLCRWGGDEFLIIRNFSNRNQAQDYAEQVIQVLSEPLDWEGISLSVGASIGISLYPEQTDQARELIQYADMAMFHQKKQRPSQVRFFDKSIAEQHHQEMKLKAGLADAISKNELRLVYQPIVSSQNGQPVAMEALLRWCYNGQAIGPDQFIPIAEQYGLILDIGKWVLRAACAEVSRWQSQAPIPVCVNVSLIQLLDVQFEHILEQAIFESDIKPGQLQIEITESVFAADKQIISKKIQYIQGLGVKVSIDDFGTGYSSLSVMQELSVNAVKLDRAFINKLDAGGFAIVTAVTHAARLLNFEIVAEGVETKKQMKRLAKLGVPKLQGFYFSQPLETDQLSEYFSNATAIK